MITVDALSPSGSIAKVDFYRSGNLLATRSAPPYSFTWSNLAKGLYTVSIQATGDHGQTGTAGLTLTVNGPNAPPTVSLTAPGGGTIYSAPATINLAATATDSDGTIAQVAFHQNGNLLNATNVGPYAFTWTDVPAGSYTLTAQATDDRDGTTTSAPVNVTVAPPSAPPTVALTAPASGASYATGATITLAATASDPDGEVRKVDFYQGGTLIGSSTQAPYTLQWTTLQAGSYTLTATATDDTGVAATSAPVTVSVVKSTITYTHNDLLGSPIAATDEDGNVLWKESYKPYGERLNNNPAAAGERQWYTGKPQDKETGLSYYGARYYDPAIGRFMGVDAADFSEKNLHSFNRYAYANNNPYRYIDPNGMWSVEALFPPNAPVVVAGKAWGAVAAWAVGAASGDTGLQAAAIQGMRENQQANIETAVVLGTMGRGGKGNAVSDSTVVCRGGSCTAEAFAGGKGVTVEPITGKLDGISTGLGESVAAASKNIPHKRVGE